MNFFGRKKGTSASKASTTATAGGGETPMAKIGKMKKTCENLEKREELLQKKILNLNKEAKQKSQSGNRKAALMCIKRRKLVEKELEKVAGSRLNIETMILSVEAASVNVDVVQSIQAGKSAMTKINQANDIEKVEDLMDDIAEVNQLAEEVSDVLSNPIGAMDDDDELLAELDGLDDLDLGTTEKTTTANTEADSTDQLLRELQSLDAKEPLPIAPSGKIEIAAGAVDDDEAELRALQAEMEM